MYLVKEDPYKTPVAFVRLCRDHKSQNTNTHWMTCRKNKKKGERAREITSAS